eukprot:scaffold54847_cov33-Phaeocystis_antarctica.AAC.1
MRLAARRLTRLDLLHVLLTLTSLRGYHMREERPHLSPGRASRRKTCYTTRILKTQRLGYHMRTLGPRNCRAHLAPHTFSGARDGVLVAVAAVKTRRIDLHVPLNGSGEPESSLGYGCSRIPAMASSQSDVRPSPMAYPAVRSLPKLPLPLRPETGPTS